MVVSARCLYGCLLGAVVAVCLVCLLYCVVCHDALFCFVDCCRVFVFAVVVR